MTVLIWQIFLFALFFALIGCVLGWFLRDHFIPYLDDTSEGDDSKAEAELKNCEKRVKELEKEITQLENQVDATTVSSVAQKKTKTTSKTENTSKTGESLVSKQEAKTTSKKGSTKKSSSKSSSKGSSVKASKAAASTPDNLKEINGIGKVIETALNEVDITTFAQVAKLKTGDKELIAKKLKTFTDRIERDKWIEQATALHKAKYGKNP